MGWSDDVLAKLPTRTTCRFTMKLFGPYRGCNTPVRSTGFFGLDAALFVSLAQPS